MRPASTRHGFTLIELSIVLVIIGLITGGILVGRDLIRAAEIRATVSQVEKYDSAVNSFRGKYGYIPGDIPYNVASQFGFFTFSGVGAGGTNMGNGNGMIGDAIIELGEPLAFWRHLSDANLIDGTYGSIGIAALNGIGSIPGEVGGILQHRQYFPLLIPPAKAGDGLYFIVYSDNSFNYFALGAFTLLDTGGQFRSLGGLTPIEAQNFDAKTDDGLPLTGNTLARAQDDIAPGNEGTPTSPCVTAANAYDVGNTNGSTQSCAMQMRFR